MALSIENSLFCFVNNFQHAMLEVNICETGKDCYIIFLRHRTFQ